RGAGCSRTDWRQVRFGGHGDRDRTVSYDRIRRGHTRDLRAQSHLLETGVALPRWDQRGLLRGPEHPVGGIPRGRIGRDRSARLGAEAVYRKAGARLQTFLLPKLLVP